METHNDSVCNWWLGGRQVGGLKGLRYNNERSPCRRVGSPRPSPPTAASPPPPLQAVHLECGCILRGELVQVAREQAHAADGQVDVLHYQRAANLQGGGKIADRMRLYLRERIEAVRIHHTRQRQAPGIRGVADRSRISFTCFSATLRQGGSNQSNKEVMSVLCVSLTPGGRVLSQLSMTGRQPSRSG